MKSPLVSACGLMACLCLCSLLVSQSLMAAAIDATSYPREFSAPGGRVWIHHPSVSGWKDFRSVTGSLPLKARLSDGSEWHATARFSVDTVVDLDHRLVELENPTIEAIDFQEAEPPLEADALVREALAAGPGKVALDFMLRALPEDFEIPRRGQPATGLNMDPPRIEFTQSPRRLMLIDGPPAYASIDSTGLDYIINTDWMVFRHQASNRWLILDDGAWLENSMLASGQWRQALELPDDFVTLQLNSDWPQVAAAMPPRAPERSPLPLLISYEPTELVQTEGPPAFQSSGESGLEYADNTSSDLFRYADRYYLLIAGRWFSNRQLKGQWASVRQLPAVFGEIPHDHPRGHVRASVPGTPEARLAAIEAAIPRVAVVRVGQASDLEIPWVGAPQFTPIEGTGLQRAVNTPYQVVQHNNFYYLCHEGAWYASSQPAGPWQAAAKIPEEIYDIPATDPLYNVTFVRAEAFDDSSDRIAYYSTSEYYGTYWSGSSLVYGTGWYHPGFYHPAAYWHHPWSWRYHGYRGPYYPYAYPYYHYSETFDVNQREKDWQWGLDGSKRVVYDYGPLNTVGSGRYDPGNAKPGLPDNRPLTPANAGDDDHYTGRDGGIYRRVGGQWQKQQGAEWLLQPEGMIRYDLEQQYQLRHSAYRDYDRHRRAY